MQIYGPFRIQTAPVSGGTNRISSSAPNALSGGAAPSGSSPVVDRLDISAAAQAASTSASSAVGESGGMRLDRIADIRRQISAGTYETPEKLDVALNRLLDQFG
jgi:negative regulator of flagellin synthesis FlgM